MPLLTSRARHILKPLKPITLSVGFSLVVPVRLFSSTPVQGNQVGCTRRLIRQLSPAASRESPYPVVFLRLRGLEGLEEEGEWKEWSSMFAEKGYTSIEIDISSNENTSSPTSKSDSNSELAPSSPSSSSSSGISSIKPMITTLSSEIRLLAIPFPPILIAQGASTLLAQAYIEDNPSSGLILINPVPDQDTRSEEVQGRSEFRWPKFGYEPFFPILVMSSQNGLLGLSNSFRLVREYGHPPKEEGQKGWFGLGGRKNKGIDIEVLDDGELNESGRVKVERWMDRQGF